MYEYKIGSTLLGITLLSDLGISGNPRPAYRPYSTSVRLANGTTQGNGFPVAEWHWDVLPAGESDILANFLNGALSAPVYIRTRLNRLSSGVYTWGTFACVMNWPTGDEDVQSRRSLGLTITFTHLVAA